MKKVLLILTIVIIAFLFFGPGPHMYWNLQHKAVKKVAYAVSDFQVVCGRFPTNEEGLEILLVKVRCGEKTWRPAKLDLSNGLGRRITYKSHGQTFTVTSRGFFDTWEMQGEPYRKNKGVDLVTPFKD